MGLTIGDAAAQSGLPVKTVRYYDEIELVSPSSRTAAGYRQYDAAELHKLTFVKRARSFGFSVDDCRQLLSLFEDQSRSSREVKAFANRRLDEIEEKMRDMQTLHAELKSLANRCPGDDQSDCPILTSLANPN
ncbi:UNVERIFIED_CONTAM: hypothetical protein GTU68_051462 [Idotea baltica]|nr:hypothetical protein [Idotea baltica]